VSLYVPVAHLRAAVALVWNRSITKNFSWPLAVCAVPTSSFDVLMGVVESVIKSPKTGRRFYKHLQNSEKTYIGTCVEIDLGGPRRGSPPNSREPLSGVLSIPARFNYTIEVFLEWPSRRPDDDFVVSTAGQRRLASAVRPHVLPTYRA
jgi:hypothetical protein